MKRIVVVVAVVALAGAAGCGILNSIFGDLDVTQQQLTDACNQVQTKCGAAGEGEGEGEGAGNGGGFTCAQFATCLSEKAGRNGCADQYNALVECVLQGSSIQCSGKPCDQEASAWAACSLNGSNGGSKTGSTGGTTTTSPLEQLCSGVNNGGTQCPPDRPIICGAQCCSNGQQCVSGQCIGTTGCTPGTSCGPSSTCNQAGICVSQTCLASCQQCSTSTDPTCCSAAACNGGGINCQSQPGCAQCAIGDNACCSTCGACSPCSGAASGDCNVGDASCCTACQSCPPTPTPTQCSDPHFVGCPGCSVTATCNRDSICDPSETAATCPEDCDPSHVCVGGAPDGKCALNENSVGCPADCTTPCNHDGHCDTTESAPECPDCSAPVNCNNNSICEAGEPASCQDCANLVASGHACTLDGICEANEGYACGDCLEAPSAAFTTHTCSGDADCAGIGNAVCPPDINEILCSNGDNQNCRSQNPETQVCWRQCTATSQCPQDTPRGYTCIPTFTQPGQGTCQPGTCGLGGGNCAASFDCIDPMTLGRDNNGGSGADGVCAHTCNPNACAQNLGSCECNTAPAGEARCAPSLQAGAINEYLCVPPGPHNVGSTCAVQSDCGVNSVCAGGNCVPLTACTTSAQCSGATPNCNTTFGVCQP